MAVDAVLTWVMGAGINGWQISPVTQVVGETGVTAQTKAAAGIYGQSFRIIWMIDSGAVTIFTLDYLMRGGHDRLVLFLVASLTVFSAFVMNLHCLPVGYCP